MLANAPEKLPERKKKPREEVSLGHYIVFTESCIGIVHLCQIAENCLDALQFIQHVVQLFCIILTMLLSGIM